MKIGIFGRGRLGSAIAALAGGRIAWQIGRDGRPGGPVDVAIDASFGPAVPAHLDWALKAGTDFLIGATGFEIDDLETTVGRRIGIVIAPNFSLTMALYARLALILGRYALKSEDRDLYVFEHHHARKADAPSGTARLLASVLMKGCPRKTCWTISSPKQALKPSELSIGVLRAGHTYSSHVVGLDTPGEVLEISHAARSAAPYAEGALAAAEWILGRKGVYTMEDVATEILAPLFSEVRP
jgi:4-hydroxy-tetrahydrodipicolinate reductase